MNLISDVVYKTEEYLSLKERLHWSSVNKEYSKIINRKTIKSHISAIHLNKYIKYNFPISDEINIREEIKEFMEPKIAFAAGERDFWTLKYLSDDILKIYNIHIYSDWVDHTKCYKVDTLIVSENIWDQNPRFIRNQKVCAVYRFRKLGLMKKKIKTSLMVKALIY